MPTHAGNVVLDRIAWCVIAAGSTINMDSSRALATPGRRSAAATFRSDRRVIGRQARQPAHLGSAGCLIGRVRPVKETGGVTYSDQIAHIFQNRCVECHREGQIGPFTLTSYEEAAGWAEMIEEVVRDQRMPPWHADPHFGTFSNDSSLTQDEKDQIYAWVANGGRGDPKKLPEPRKFPGTHMMPYEPDMIIPMADEAFDVPAEGTVEYKYFAVDPGFTEDKWVKVAECLPDNRGVVHHIIVFIKPPEGTAKGIEALAI